MQAKGVVKFFIGAMVLVCLYQLSFTWVASSHEKKARVYADSMTSDGSEYEILESMSAEEREATYNLKDSLYQEHRYYQGRYFDSMSDQVVLNLGLIKYDLKSIRAKQLSLGLDLQGGMSVVLEIDQQKYIRGFSYNPSITYSDNVQKAIEIMEDDPNKDFVTALEEAYGNEGSIAEEIYAHELIQTEGINRGSTNGETFTVLRDLVNEATKSNYEKLKLRLDKFGVTQPNIELQEDAGRIIVELPGAQDPARVRNILAKTAELQFWNCYHNEEVINGLYAANEVLKDVLKFSEDENDSIAKANVDLAIAKADSARELLKDSAIANGDSAVIDSLNMIIAGEASAQSAYEELRGQYNPLLSKLQLNFDPNSQNNTVPGGPVVGFARGIDTTKINELLRYPDVVDLITTEAPQVRFVWDGNPIPESEDLYRLYAVKKEIGSNKPLLTGDYIKSSSQSFDEFGNPSVLLNFNSQGSTIWANMTEDASSPSNQSQDKTNRSIAVVLDNKVYSAPEVLGKIVGSTEIRGGFSAQEAADLSDLLEAGKLDAPLLIVQEETVGPSLGKASIRAGLISLVTGFLLVILFMVFYYSTSGIISNIALLLNLFFIIGTLSSLSASLTLPGFAGLVLTIGMAVDANVIIYERIREELTKGKGLKLAIKDGYTHSYSAIIDANLTTLITGLFLLFFGLGPVKGFATVLVIGIISSMFTAVVVTRMLFDTSTARDRGVKFFTKLTEGAFKNLNFQFIDRRKITYAGSTAILLIGLVSIFALRGFELGVGFQGGHSYVVQLNDTPETEQIASNLNEIWEGNTQVKLYGGNNQIQVTTAHLINSTEANVDSILELQLMQGVRDYLDDGDKPLASFQTNDILQRNKVQPTIADDIKKSSIRVTLLAALGIFLYLLIRFRKWQFGVGALVAVLHDVLFILAIFSLLHGILPFSMEIDQAFIAALLTVIGYSINDTVVIFDRIREYLLLHPTTDLKTNVNNAVNSTLSRTLITSFTTLLVVLILLIFGGEAIRGFSFALFIGILVGTYSSIFVATPITLDLLSRKANKK